MANPTNANLTMPYGWEMAPEEAAHFWGDPLAAELLEAMPAEPVISSFHDWLHENPDEVALFLAWGVPDFEAAMAMMDVTRAEFAAALEVQPVQIEALENGIAMPKMSSLVCMASLLGWPIAVFFRDADRHWHPKTALGRAFGFPEDLS